MSKHLVDIDEQALVAARTELGTRTIKEIVNRALQQAGRDRDRTVERSLNLLAESDLTHRENVWR